MPNVLPIVTGVSPNKTAFGSKLTIRGENFGSTLEELSDVIILGVDCLMSAQWCSPNKITALCPAREATGVIIVVTKSGGVGTCTIQFEAFRPSVGWLIDVAFWPSEPIPTRRQNYEFTSHGIDQDDPLGLSVEASEQPRSSFGEVFAVNKSSDISSQNFDPIYFLLEHHYNATLVDLKAGLSYLERKVAGNNESQLMFIKANVGNIIDQLDILKTLKLTLETDRKHLDSNTVENEVLLCTSEADAMFTEMLRRKDRADTVRSALNVMNRFRFLFNLPITIRSNIEKGDFDRAIDEYERAHSLYGDCKLDIFGQYFTEIEKAADELRQHILAELHSSWQNLDGQKKLIGNLIQLGVAGDSDPAWDCIWNQHQRLIRQLDEPSLNSSTSILDYITLLTQRFSQLFPDLWKLGQAYFKGDLIQSKRIDLQAVSEKHNTYKEIVMSDVDLFVSLIRAAVIGPSETDDKLLPACLKCIRQNYGILIGLDLPRQPLDTVKYLITDLRLTSLRYAFQCIMDASSVLYEAEDWQTDTGVDSDVLVRTSLPDKFEFIVMDAFETIKNAIVTDENSREDNILTFKNANADLETLIENVLKSFVVSQEKILLANDDGPEDSPPLCVKLLLCANNCCYILTKILPKLQKSFQEISGLSLEMSISSASRAYAMLSEKLLGRYVELKADPIIRVIEPSMYAGKFDWARCPKPSDARDYVKEIILNMVFVHCEVTSINSDRLINVMQSLCECVAEELNRLMTCIHRMNSNGCTQAWIDLNCLRSALGVYLTSAANNHFQEAARPLLQLDQTRRDANAISECEHRFKKKMALHLIALC